MLTTEEWERLLVVNRGSHQARYRNAATQYFEAILGGNHPSWSYQGESDRVVYAEALRPTHDSLDLLATIVIDAEASRAFFGDQWRLSEDVLSDGAARCIADILDRRAIAEPHVPKTTTAPADSKESRRTRPSSSHRLPSPSRPGELQCPF